MPFPYCVLLFVCIHGHCCESFYVSVCILNLCVGSEFPIDFIQIIRKMFRQYHIILAHIYFHHFHEFKRLQLHDGLNTLFLHFTYFVVEYSLIEPKELSILEDLVVRLKHHEEVLAKRPRSDEFSESDLSLSKS